LEQSNIFGLAVAGILTYLLYEDIQDQGQTDLSFSEIDTDFTHSSDFVTALPFMALSTIDMDNDGVDEIFVGGGVGQQDAILIEIVWLAFRLICLFRAFC
jgi:hypothetical protein